MTGGFGVKNTIFIHQNLIGGGVGKGSFAKLPVVMSGLIVHSSPNYCFAICASFLRRQVSQ